MEESVNIKLYIINRVTSPNDNLVKTNIVVTPVAGVSVTTSKIYKQGKEVYGYVALNITSQIAANSEILSFGIGASYFTPAIYLHLYGALQSIVSLGNGTNMLVPTGTAIPVGTYYIQIRGWTNA